MKTRERIAQLKQLGKVYAKAKAECDYLKHFRKSKLAMLKSEYLKEDSRRSNKACEDLARQDPKYLEVLEGLKQATQISEAAHWELKTSHAGIHLFQTERADRRAELQSLNDIP